MHLVKPTTPASHTMEEIQNKQTRFMLASLLRLSEKMLDAATNKDWEAVEILEKERSESLGQLTLDLSDSDFSETLVEAYATLLHINEQIMGVVSLEKKNIMFEFKNGKQASNAIQSYQTT